MKQAIQSLRQPPLSRTLAAHMPGSVGKPEI